jgi:hypothetical protein
MRLNLNGEDEKKFSNVDARSKLLPQVRILKLKKKSVANVSCNWVLAE